jgi:hypothetical protein
MDPNSLSLLIDLIRSSKDLGGFQFVYLALSIVIQFSVIFSTNILNLQN